MNTPSPLLRQIPAVDQLLEQPELRALIAQSSRPFVLELTRAALESVRQELAGHPNPTATTADLAGEIVLRILATYQAATSLSLKKVINATGVILHTNLGRAPLCKEAISSLLDIACGYSNLEYDLQAGRRGKRDSHIERLLEMLLGCEQAIVVNNNAAAIFLILNALAEEGEVLISRGELIEIGDSFRIPDILKKSGARLCEVGTTNKTHLFDYREALNEKTRLLLRVHPSNFHMEGFTSRPGLRELADLCNTHGIPLVEDLGSGCMVDLTPYGIPDELPAAASLQAGAHLVCFSGDKLLGGPQAGIIAGRRTLVQHIRRNPLFRALRPDKLTLAALQGTLLEYLKKRDEASIPLLEMMRQTSSQIETRAQAVIEQVAKEKPELEMTLIDGASKVGGGSTPAHGLPTKLIALSCNQYSSQQLEQRLRAATPPILARQEQDRVLLDLRTVAPEEELHLVAVLRTLV